MPQEILDYRSARKPPPRPEVVRMATRYVLTTTVLVNIVLLGIAASNGGMGPLGIAIIFGPITNCLIVVIALGCTPIIRGRSKPASLDRYVWASVMAPTLAAMADFVLILTIGAYRR